MISSSSSTSKHVILPIRIILNPAVSHCTQWLFEVRTLKLLILISARAPTLHTIKRPRPRPQSNQLPYGTLGLLEIGQKNKRTIPKSQRPQQHRSALQLIRCSYAPRLLDLQGTHDMCTGAVPVTMQVKVRFTQLSSPLGVPKNLRLCWRCWRYDTGVVIHLPRNLVPKIISQN